MKYTIVGIDPGHTLGYCILDLKGNVVKVGSLRGHEKHKLMGILLGNGKPIIVAADVNPAPDFVKRLAAKLGARLYKPAKPLSVERKMKMTNGLRDYHSRDAYAAALKAYHHFENRFRRIEKLYPDMAEEY